MSGILGRTMTIDEHHTYEARERCSYATAGWLAAYVLGALLWAATFYMWGWVGVSVVAGIGVLCAAGIAHAVGAGTDR